MQADLLTVSQYSDVVDERNIDHLCGYPLCDQQLVNVPKQKYHISTATNQVLDLTQRKVSENPFNKFYSVCLCRSFVALSVSKLQISTAPNSLLSLQWLWQQSGMFCQLKTEFQ